KTDSSMPRFRPRMFMGDRMEDEEPKDLSSIRVEVQIPFKNDSLPVIEKEYRKSLQSIGIHLPFVLSSKPIDSSQLKGMARFSQQGKKSIETVNILRRLNPEMLVAQFDNPFFLLLKRLQWLLLFAFVMLAFTTMAFVFMYRSLRQQHQLAAMKNDFIANITHELKTPVATVSVAIEALKNFNAISDAQRTKEYLDISSLELQRLNLLVDKVMKLSMFEQDKMEIQQERIDMKQLVEEVVKSMKLQFEKYAAEVSIHFEGDAFFTRGDRMHLQSVVFNLLDNALKYSPDQPKIGVELKSLPNALQLKITDNGIGIASEYKQKVFEKFFRVPHGNTHNIKGYGLGLSYVHEVVQQHGGTITVESKEGTGSIFTVELKREA
ncbi:MAG TPA: HAMP domain-containing sensor histidine kinase, partial [Methylotenera sp.]|nr:HAMP domain-containing sensor histidine kinase [Methylotenera sp.]